MSIFDDWFIHRCDVETITQADEWGAQTTVPHTDVPCLVDGGVQLTPSGTGVDTVSTTRLYLQLESGPWFTPNSKVTVNGFASEVDSVTYWDGDENLNCVVVTLK